MDTPQDLPPNPQEELPLSRADASVPPNLEMLLKQFHELQARFKDHARKATTDIALWQEQYLYLRKLFLGVVVALLLLLLGVCLFFGKQMRMVRQQLDQQRPFILRSLQDFHTRVEPSLQQFAIQLQAFAAAHPDFRPILDAHRGALAEYFTLIQPALPPQPILPTNPPPPPGSNN